MSTDDPEASTSDNDDEPADLPASRDDAYRTLASLYGSGGPDDMDDGPASPTFWPDLPAVDLPGEYQDLREWVERLIERFPHLDHHTIPSCWWRHNGHVEALSALRDNERVNYADSAPGSAATSWHREFAFIESRLRDWTSHAGCGSMHREPIAGVRPSAAGEWNDWVDQQVKAREVTEIVDSASG